MDCYLAFVDEIGISSEGGFIYRFDFTLDTSVVWGDSFNITPAVIIPDIQPSIQCLCREAKVIFPYRMLTAKKNTCFSMQDCIDGIIPLCFTDIDEDTILIDGKPLLFNFGETYDDVVNKLNKLNIKLFEEQEVNAGDDSMLNDILNGDTLEQSIGDNDGDNFEE